MSSVQNFEVGPELEAAWGVVGFAPGISHGSTLASYDGLSEFFEPRRLDLTSSKGRGYEDWESDFMLRRAIGGTAMRCCSNQLNLLANWAHQQEAEHAVAAVSFSDETRPGSWAVAVFDDKIRANIANLSQTIAIETFDSWKNDPVHGLIGHAIYHAVDTLRGSVTIVSGSERLDIDLDDADLARCYTHSWLSSPVVGTLVMSRMPQIA